MGYGPDLLSKNGLKITAKTGFEPIYLIEARGPKKFQKLLWVHRRLKPTIDFPETFYPMGDSLCPLVRQLVKQIIFLVDVILVRAKNIRNGL